MSNEAMEGWQLDYLEQGYTDLFFQEGRWWAFPPNGVMPVVLERPKSGIEKLIEDLRRTSSIEPQLSPYCYPERPMALRMPQIYFQESAAAEAEADTASRSAAVSLGMKALRAAAETLRQHNVPPYPPSYPFYPNGYYGFDISHSMSEDLRTELASSATPSEGLDNAINHLCSACQMTRPIALLRFREFCEQNKITEEALAKLINSRQQVQVKHGVICLRRGARLKKSDYDNS